MKATFPSWTHSPQMWHHEFGLLLDLEDDHLLSGVGRRRLLLGQAEALRLGGEILGLDVAIIVQVHNKIDTRAEEPEDHEGSR